MKRAEARRFLVDFLTDEKFRQLVEMGSEDAFADFDFTEEEKKILAQRGPDMTNIVASAMREGAAHSDEDSIDPDDLDPVATVRLIRAIITIRDPIPPNVMAEGSDRADDDPALTIEEAVELVRRGLPDKKYENLIELIKLIDRD